MSNAFGDMLKKLRTAKRVTLRDFCLKNGLDPGNYSRIERGLFPPPQKTELIEKYAIALEINPGSEQWIELFDLAAASRGEIPADLLEDRELLKKLPILFRTLRGRAVSRESMDELADRIRRS